MFSDVKGTGGLGEVGGGGGLSNGDGLGRGCGGGMRICFGLRGVGGGGGDDERIGEFYSVGTPFTARVH